jgi:two-component system LytT family sensor kinase
MLRELYAIIGMITSVLLLLLLKRQPDRQREWVAGVLLATTVFLVFASAFTSTALNAAGTPHHNWLFLLSNRFTRSVAAFAPSILFFGWRVSPIFKEDPPIGTALFRFTVASATLITLLIWFGPSSWMTDNNRNQLFLFNTLFVLLLGFRALLKHRLSASLRLCMVITGAFYSFSIIVAITNPRGAAGSSPMDICLMLLQEICSLVGILGSFIFVARFRFADVFVKWSVRLVVLGILSSAGAIGITRIPPNVASAGSYSLLIGSAGLFFLIALAVAIVPVTDGWVEHWVLHQADLSGQLEQISSRMRAIHSEPDLLLEVDQQLIKCLDLTMARTLPAKELPKVIVDNLCSLSDIMDASSMRSRLPFEELPNVELLLPVTVDGNTRYAIAICPGFGRRTLFSSEVQFLRTIARELGIRIQHLQGEAAARQQALRESLLRNQLTEAELRALRAQVNPHFLFNSLNTIADIELLVADNGIGCEKRQVPLATLSTAFRPSGVGLANTAARLHTIYGDRASLNVESAPMQGCRVSITYPLEVPLYALSDH